VRRTLLVVGLVVAVLSFATVAYAQEGPEMPDVGPLGEYVAAVGVGAVIMVVIEILKRIGVIPDGQAGVWVSVANVVAFAGLYVADVFGFDVMGDLPQQVLEILEQVGKLILMFLSAVGSFKAARSARVIKPMKSRVGRLNP
jgi:hypothetical protein